MYVAGPAVRATPGARQPRGGLRVGFPAPVLPAPLHGVRPRPRALAAPRARPRRGAGPPADPGVAAAPAGGRPVPGHHHQPAQLLAQPGGQRHSVLDILAASQLFAPALAAEAPSMHADITTHCSAVCGEACSGCCYWPRASGSAVPGGGPAPANYSRGCWRHRPAPPRTPRNICPQLDRNIFN